MAEEAVGWQRRAPPPEAVSVGGGPARGELGGVFSDAVRAVPGSHLSCPPRLVSAEELACVLPAETEEPVTKSVEPLLAKTTCPDLESLRDVWGFTVQA